MSSKAQTASELLRAEMEYHTREAERRRQALVALGELPATAKAVPPEQRATVRVRAGEGETMADVAMRVLRAHGSPMHVKAITDGMLAAGYQSDRQTLLRNITRALTRVPGRVQRTGRAMYGLSEWNLPGE